MNKIHIRELRFWQSVFSLHIFLYTKRLSKTEKTIVNILPSNHCNNTNPYLYYDVQLDVIKPLLFQETFL